MMVYIQLKIMIQESKQRWADLFFEAGQRRVQELSKE